MPDLPGGEGDRGGDVAEEDHRGHREHRGGRGRKGSDPDPETPLSPGSVSSVVSVVNLPQRAAVETRAVAEESNRRSLRPPSTQSMWPARWTGSSARWPKAPAVARGREGEPRRESRGRRRRGRFR